MEDYIEKTLILQALKSKQYEVKYKPSNSIFKCKTKRKKIYYVQWDVHRLGLESDLGNFTFIIQTGVCHTFVYDMNEGSWSGDELCADQDIIQALQSLDEFIDSEEYSGYPEWQIYCKVHGIDENIGYYWYEDEDCPGNLE